MRLANHPNGSRLALYAGGDLGFWERRRVRGHVSKCSQCQDEVRAFHAASVMLADPAGNNATPVDAHFARLAQEMTGNIRVGLAAGECIAGFEKTIRLAKPREFQHAALLLMASGFILCAALWLNLPSRQMDHLVSVFGRVQDRVRWDRVGTTFRPASTLADAVVIEASTSSIQVKTNDHSLSLMHPASDGATVSMNTQDSAAVRYVDADSGQVTINKVYYAQ